jgi:hypothetical protein
MDSNGYLTGKMEYGNNGKMIYSFGTQHSTISSFQGSKTPIQLRFLYNQQLFRYLTVALGQNCTGCLPLASNLRNQ